MKINDALDHISNILRKPWDDEDNRLYHIQLFMWLKELLMRKDGVYMSLEEAILELKNELKGEWDDCEQCKKEHEQILEWLLNLRRLRDEENKQGSQR